VDDRLYLVPALPESRPLTLDDKTWLQPLLRAQPLAASEMTFTNLFAWGAAHPVRLARWNDTLLFWRGPGEEGMLLSPWGALDAAGIGQALAWSRSLGGMAQFGRVPAAVAEMLAIAEPRLTVVADRDNFDYVYRVQDLVDLPGRPYDGKRNQIKKFEQVVTATYMPLIGDLVREAALMQDLWCERRACEDSVELSAEDLAVKTLLAYWDDLDVFGGALLDGDNLIAFTVAEPLTADTAVCHFEKADTNYPGVYQALNREFAREALSAFAFVNREQDLGVPGLRQAKLSYRPAALWEKFTLSYK